MTPSLLNLIRGHHKMSVGILAFLVLLPVVGLRQMRAHGISAAIAQQVSAEPSRILDLGSLGPPAWTRVCIFGPYTSSSYIDEKLGFKIGNSSLEMDDGVNLLVFVRGKDVVAITEHPRGVGDFVEKGLGCFQRSEAKFVPYRDTYNWVHLRAADAK